MACPLCFCSKISFCNRKGLLTILLHERNCSAGREYCFMLLLLNVRMNDQKSVIAGTCSSASTGMLPLLSLKPANGSRNNDKSQLMLLSPIENQTCSICQQQPTTIDDCFSKKNVTYLTGPPSNSSHYEIFITVIRKLRYNTLARRQKRTVVSLPDSKDLNWNFLGLPELRLNGQNWTRHIPEGAVVKTELYTHFIRDLNGLHTYHFSYGQSITDWGNADDQAEPLQAADNQEEA